MVTEQQIFILAEQALQKVVEQITDDQWNKEAPSYMVMGDQKQTIRDLVNRHVYDDVWVPETLAGNTIEAVGTKYDGDLLGAEPKKSFAQAVATATTAVEALTEDDMSRPVHLTYGDFPIREYLKHITSYRGFRAYTIAHFLGFDDRLEPALVQGLWDEVMPDVEQWRAWGVFGPAVPVADNANLQTKLLGMVGFLQK